MLCSKCGKAYIDKNGYCVRCREVTLYVKPPEPTVVTKPLLEKVQLCPTCSTAYVDITGYCPRCRVNTVFPAVQVPELTDQPLGETGAAAVGKYVTTKVEEDETHEFAGEEDPVE